MPPDQQFCTVNPLAKCEPLTAWS